MAMNVLKKEMASYETHYQVQLDIVLVGFPEEHVDAAIAALKAVQAKIHSLEMHRCMVTASTFSFAAGCGELHTLKLIQCHELMSVEGLSACGSLHTLDLSHCRNLRSVQGLSSAEICTPFTSAFAKD